MTTSTEEKELKKPEKKVPIWSKEEKANLGPQYGCDIVVEDGSPEDVATKNASSPRITATSCPSGGSPA